MALETGTYISDLVVTNPTATDPISQGDDHDRLTKACIKATFPNLTGAMTATQTELNYMVGATTNPAMKDGSNLTTPAAGDNTTKIATTAFVNQTAFSAALPAQPGGATRYKLRTLAGLASWVIEQMVRSSRVANAILTDADSGTFVDVTAGTFSQTLTAAATLGDGWFCLYRNNGTGVVTLDPNGAELIDGAATKVLQPTTTYAILCDAIGFYTITLDDQSFDANSGLYYNSFFTQTSGSFTAKKTGWHRLTGVGAGGSGAVSMPSLVGTPGKATGGAAGGFCSKRIWLAAGATITYTIGAGGAAATRAATNGVANGNAGGATTITANGFTLTANGGNGGTASITAAAVAGATGGSATGGDINVTGGASGNCTGLGRAATGGGSIGIGGAAFASGIADAQVANSDAATGGAGTGGASGNSTCTAAVPAATATGGGGAAGAAAAVSAAVATAGAGGIGSSPPIALPTNCGAAGGAGSVAANGAAVTTAGGGSGGLVSSAGSTSTGSAVLGGTGGGTDPSTGGTNFILTANANLGCGGGAAVKCVNNVTVTSSAGGNGYALIEW